MQRVLSIAQPQITSHGDDWGTIRLARARIVASLFGCWHRRMSWPITRGHQTYRACLRCGMCRSFDPKTWKTFGPFYNSD